MMIKKILIVDDSPIARKMLKSCLPKDQNYEFQEAGNGQEGVEKYKEMKPDLTFMDLTMPVMTGYEAIDHIIAYDKNALIVVVTADVQMKSIKQVMESGAYMVIKKPMNKESIQMILEKVDDTLQKTES